MKIIEEEIRRTAKIIEFSMYRRTTRQSYEVLQGRNQKIQKSSEMKMLKDSKELLGKMLESFEDRMRKR